MDRWATFDCYGTLIDWSGGVRAALAGIWPQADADVLLRRYHELEPALQEGGARTYREVLTDVVPALAAAEGLAVPPGSAPALSDSLPAWRPFPEVPASLRTLRDRGWRLAILSNTDPDYLDASLALIGVDVDERVVASEIGSYKPGFAHWETFFRRTGADRGRHVHVAASLFHDVEPAAALGLPCVWINRLGETSPLPRAGELPDLASLPDLLDDLVPG
ncbi:MAG TPA: HAD-IA family hydrolase [Actinomycetota bacterium]